MPRSLAYVTLVCNFFISAILGSANAQVAVMSRVILPEMEKQGYRRNFAAALNAGASLLGPIVPPSMIFIIYAVVARVSIGDMFIAGVIPGIILSAFIALIIAFSNVWEPGAQQEVASEVPRASGWREAMPLIGALSVPVVIVVSILGGIVTPTESAGLAVVLSLIVTWTMFEPISMAESYRILVRTALNSAIVLFLIATARVFGYILTYYRVPQATSELLVDLSSGPVTFLLLVVLLLLILGALMEGMAAVIILVPILLPTAVDVYGIDPIVFGIIFTLTLVIGLITPPVGTVLYIASAMSGVKIGPLSAALLPYVVVSTVVVLLIIIFPVLATALL